MRHVLMFVAGFAVVAVTGVAMAQTGLLAGESTEPEEWPAYATQTVELPIADKPVATSPTGSSTKTETTKAKTGATGTATKSGDTSEPVSKVETPLVWSISQKVKQSETPAEKFYGTGSPGMKITATSPHGTASTTIDKSGNWALGVSFESTPGSTFTVTVTTSTGWINNYSFSHLGAKTTTTTTTKTTKTNWTIAQKSAENTEPWTKFYGTGPEGTTVKATSDHGSAEVEVGKQGDWYLQVHFDVPAGTVIGVRVTNSLGFDQTFHFVWKSYELAVQQKFGSSNTDPAYEVFWGTAAPNSWVKVSSAFGWTKVATSKTGSFEATLHFENAPLDIAFEIEVYDAAGNRKTFMFTRLGASA